MGWPRALLGVPLVLVVSSCAPAANEPGSAAEHEPASTLVQQATQAYPGVLKKKWSDAASYRGKQAHYVVCSGQPFLMAFMFENRGAAVWRDVKPGKGDTKGSDVYLVTSTGKKDKLTGSRTVSVRRNANSYVRGDRKAKNCSHKNGCRRTIFEKQGMAALAPQAPGIYVSRWRVRDFSKAWKKGSKAYSRSVGLRFLVNACGPQCSCSIKCDNGVEHTISATCSADGESLCSLLPDPCAGGSGGASGSGGSGNGGAGASGSGGFGGAVGGGGAGASGGGASTASGGASTASGGAAGTYDCGGVTCEPLPAIWTKNAAVQPCCTANGACGYSSSLHFGQCKALGPPAELEGGFDPDPQELSQVPEADPEGFIDPQDPDLPGESGTDLYRGEAIGEEEGGCSFAGSRGGGGSGAAWFVFATLLAAWRRRLSS